MLTTTTSFLAALAAASLLLSGASAAPSPDRYDLVNSYGGSNFFSGWSFWDQPDPTNGFVNYTDKQTSMDANLAGYIFNNATGEHTAFMGVDYTTMNPAAGRASVRISSDQTWSAGGLFVADVRHSPQGACGSWPALWLVGPDWPHQGEIDIIEGVNDDVYNSMTLHTGPNCQSSLTKKNFLGKQVTTDCDVSSGESNTGCSIRGSFSTSYDAKTKSLTKHAAAAQGFNAQGGGVYATLWDASGITIWMFPHSALPADLVAGKPDPASWSAIKPVAAFGGRGCDYAASFKNLQLVVDTTFCGDWAGKQEVWDSSPACKAKAPTCQEFVANNPAAFKDAFWEIASVKVFQTAAQQGASGTKPVAGVSVSGNGKRGDHAFPAALGDLIPPPHLKGGDADCANMTGTPAVNSTTANSPSGTAAAPSSTASGNAGGYGNSTGFEALRGRFARVN